MANYDAIISLSMRDELGVPASLPLYARVADTTTVAQLATDVDALVTLVAGVTLDSIQAAITLKIENIIQVAPLTGAESERGVIVNMDQANTTRSYGFWVPGLNPSLVVDGHVVVGSGALKDLTDAISAGISHLSFTSEFGNDVGAWLDAAEAFRKLRRRAEKLTRVFTF